MLLHAGLFLLLLLLAGLLSLVVVLVLSTGRRLLVVVLEVVGGLRLVELSRLELLLADLGRLGRRADEGLEVAALDDLLVVSCHRCEHSLALTGGQLCDDSRRLDK